MINVNVLFSARLRTLLINANVVRPEERDKPLGVHIDKDNTQNFGHHIISHICQKAGKQVKMLGRLS